MASKLTLSCQTAYPLYCGSDALDMLCPCIQDFACKKRLSTPPKLAIVCDTNTAQIVHHLVVPLLAKEGFVFKILCVKPGEASKSLEYYEYLCSELRSFHFKRSDLVIAIGGGVVGDLAGFVASSYMRGVSWINIPTSLLAMVDASIGGKVALNLCGSKNMLGAFWNPCATLIDIRCLATLPNQEFYQACAEIIKHGFLGDASLLTRLNTCPLTPSLVDTHPEYLCSIILRSLKLKALYVEQDPKEGYRRALLNFGHSLGHAIESKAHGTMPHGDCVALGMLIIIRSLVALSSREDLLCRFPLKNKSSLGSALYYQSMLDTLKKLLLLHKLPTNCPFDVQDFFDELIFDKKAQGDTIGVILLGKDSRAFLERMSMQDFRTFVELGWGTHG